MTKAASVSTTPAGKLLDPLFSHYGDAMKREYARPEQTETREMRVARDLPAARKELREEFDMPGYSLDQMRKNVLGPVKLLEDEDAPA